MRILIPRLTSARTAQVLAAAFPSADAVIAGTYFGDLRCWSLSTGALQFQVKEALVRC